MIDCFQLWWIPAGIIQVANKATQRLMGYKKAEMEGKNVSMLMPPPFCHRHNAYLRTHINTGELNRKWDAQATLHALHTLWHRVDIVLRSPLLSTRSTSWLCKA